MLKSVSHMGSTAYVRVFRTCKSVWKGDCKYSHGYHFQPILFTRSLKGFLQQETMLTTRTKISANDTGKHTFPEAPVVLLVCLLSLLFLG